MNYKEINPDKSLLNFIKRYWLFENKTFETQYYTILPDGYFDLILTISSGHLETISLFGLWTKPTEVVIPADKTIIGVTFKPIAAEYILKRPIAEILNSNEILDRCFWNIPSLPFIDLEKFVKHLSATISIEYSLDHRKTEIFNLLFDSCGSISVELLSEKVSWASRQINRYFKSRLGLSLKTYANILRCSAAYTNIRDGELAPSLGFYDQSHFIKEIKKYTGSNPKELHQNENDRFLQFSTLPKD